jgi:glycosyltransferase involved in cell wall biosynthesis
MLMAPIVPLSEIHKRRPFFELPREFNRQGHEGILVAGKIKVLNTNGVKVYETGVGTNAQIDIVRAFRKTFKFLCEEKPEIAVFFHMNLLLSFFIALYKFRGFFSRHRNSYKKTTWVLKLDWDGTKFFEIGNIGMRLRNLFLSYNSLFLDYIVAESSCAYDATIHLPLVDKKKVKVIPNSYSSDFPIIKYQERVRENIVLCVARISQEKGIDILVKSFVKVCKNHPDWSLDIVGPVDDDDYFSAIKKGISSKLKCNINFHGALFEKDLERKYSKSSIFCLPSNSEGFSLARTEAIASGIPIITTVAGCGKEFQNFGSIVVPIGDVEAISSSLERLMTDEQLRIKISECQQSKFPTYFKIAEEFMKLAKKIDY